MVWWWPESGGKVLYHCFDPKRPTGSDLARTIELDLGTPIVTLGNGPLDPFLEHVRSARRGSVLIGNNEEDRSGEFADLGSLGFF